MLDPTPIAFRPLEEADLPLLVAWFALPHVLHGYSNDEPRDLAAVAAKYLPRVRGEVPTHPYLILYAGHPIGYIQSYLIADWPDYAAHVRVAPDAAGIDVFIGDSGHVHRGLGAPIIRRFLRNIVFADPRVGRCVIGPAFSNAPAIRAYAKAGFAPLKLAHIPGEAEPEYLMQLERNAVMADSATAFTAPTVHPTADAFVERMPGTHWAVLPAEGATLVYWQFDQDVTVPRHNHLHAQLVIVLDGRIVLHFDDGDVALTADQVLAVPPYQYHGATLTEPTRLIDVFVPNRVEYEEEYAAKRAAS